MNVEAKKPNPTAQQVRLQINEPLRVRMLTLGFASFLIAALAWLISLAGIALAPWWAKGLLAVANAIAIGVLFIIGHDACHGILLPIRWMNRLVGRICLLPALHPYISWVHNHNGLHHGFTNIKEKDPGFPPLSLHEYTALSRWKRWIYRQNRSWYGLGLLYFTEMWLKWEVMPTQARAPRNAPAFIRDRLIVAAFALAWIGVLAFAGWWREESIIGLILIGFVLPQVIWNWIIGFIVLQQHTHPWIPWYSELDRPSPSFYLMQVQATPHLVFPAPFRFIMRHVMEHTAHHADPAVPLYHLKTAQVSLEEAYHEDIVRVRWSVRSFLWMLRICRLYDFSNHQWIDYDGKPLSAKLVAPQVIVI